MELSFIQSQNTPCANTEFMFGKELCQEGWALHTIILINGGLVSKIVSKGQVAASCHVQYINSGRISVVDVVKGGYKGLRRAMYPVPM